MAKQHKEYKELQFTDDFMFGKVMRDSELCRKMLERLLGRQIDSVRSPEWQKTIEITSDGTTKLFFNSGGDKSALSPELRSFLDYVDTGIASDDYTRELEESVWRARTNEDWRVEYMKTIVHDMNVRDEGIEIGEKTGQKRTLTEQICKKLRKGKSIPRIADELETDETTIREICRTAEKFAPDYNVEKILGDLLEIPL